MQRILLTAMDSRDGLYWYRGQPFAGIGFARAADGIVRAHLLKGGAIVGDYVSICSEGDPGELNVDLTDQIFDDQRVRHAGRPFTGIAYSFKGDVCERELLLKEGIEHASGWWNAEGLLTAFSRDADTFAELYEWYAERRPRYCEISTNASFVGRLNFSAEGQLQYLLSRRGFLANLAAIHQQARFFPFADRADLGRLECATELVLAGEDVDGSLLELLLASGALQKVTKLRIRDTGLDESNIAPLYAAPALAELTVEERDSKTEPLLAALAAHRPDVKVSVKAFRL